MQHGMCCEGVPHVAAFAVRMESVVAGDACRTMPAPNLLCRGVVTARAGRCAHKDFHTTPRQQCRYMSMGLFERHKIVAATQLCLAIQMRSGHVRPGLTACFTTKLTVRAGGRRWMGRGVGGPSQSPSALALQR